MDNRVMFKLSYGLFVLTAKMDGRDNGCIINTAMQVTTEPNRIIIVVNKGNLTHDMVAATGEFNVSILSEKSQFATYKNFGMQSGRDADKMAEVELSRAKNGIAYIASETNAYISGKVVSQTDLGTHTLFLADVTDGEILNDDASATYDYYQKNIKTAPKPKAKGFVCTVCGYIYEGDELPADFVCPWCNHGADYFEPAK